MKASGVLLVQSDVGFGRRGGMASLIHGVNANGLTVWKNSSGRTFKDIEPSE